MKICVCLSLFALVLVSQVRETAHWSSLSISVLFLVNTQINFLSIVASTFQRIKARMVSSLPLNVKFEYS